MVRLFAVLCGVLFASGAVAQVPAAATPYRTDLTRQARLVWGLNAPVAAFAAQIHQESLWRPHAVSRVGARGMAQFMPATARWWCELHRMSATDCQPTNPTWAMRALVGYDRWLWERINLGDDGDRMWAALRAYNGGLGHWYAEARNATDKRRASIDAACGSARRHVSHCRENLGYPRRILVELQPRYAAWGPRVEVAQ
jgi:soluble lytic murein transglycosylase-like protein